MLYFTKLFNRLTSARLEVTVNMYRTDIDLDVAITNDYHLGHLILDCFKQRRPQDICQINGETDEQETYQSVLTRSVRLARSLKNLGLKPGDVLTIGGPNHINVRIPFYAGMLMGLPVCGVDPLFKYAEISTLLKITQPRIAFCQYSDEKTYIKAAKDIGLDLIIVTFDQGDLTMENLIKKYDDNKPIDDFRPPSIDINKTFAWLVSTSGTTGVPKVAAIKHQVILAPIKQFIEFGSLGTVLKEGQQVGLYVSPVQWISAYLLNIGYLLTNTVMVSTSKPGIEHMIDVINKYRPTTVATSPSHFALILKNKKECDLTCFDVFSIGGAKIHKEIVNELQDRVRKDILLNQVYGQTETIGLICLRKPENPFESTGTPLPGSQVKLVDVNGEEIRESNVPGELLFKGPRFSEYFNNPEETAKVFTEDGWLKTGDQLYKDDEGNFYFVERLKMLIKYRSFHIIPPELEDIILKHPGVLEVCVTSVEHPTDSQWPVAVVVRKPGAKVTAQEIKDIVAENLSDSKKLRGGVIFVEELLKTSTGKVARVALREFAAKATRE